MGAKFAYSEDEFEALKKQDEEAQKKRHEETLASIPEAEVNAEMRTFHPARLHFIELYEEDYFARSSEKACQTLDLSLTNYLIADGLLVDVIEEEEQSTAFHTLREVIDFFRTMDEKGSRSSAIKGLGEMNADQLWETTMDPDQAHT